MKYSLPILPHDRALSDAELHGFNMACACMITWGRQLADNAITLGGPNGNIPLQGDGTIIATMAMALHRTIGQGRPRSIAPR